MRNPFHKEHFTPEQVDAAYEERGWGTKVQRRLPRAEGEPLSFQFRMPNDIRLIAVSELAAAAQDAPAWLAEQTEALDQASGEAGVVVVGAICQEDAPTDVLATLTVAFTEDLHSPIFEIEDPPPAAKVVQRVERVSDTVTKVNRISALPAAPGEEPGGLFVQEWLIQTDYGGLAMAFASSHDGASSADSLNFYREVVKTVWVGETPDPPAPG